MENFKCNDNTKYLGIPRYFITIPHRLDFSDTAQHYHLNIINKMVVVLRL